MHSKTQLTNDNNGNVSAKERSIYGQYFARKRHLAEQKFQLTMLQKFGCNGFDGVDLSIANDGQ